MEIKLITLEDVLSWCERQVQWWKKTWIDLVHESQKFRDIDPQMYSSQIDRNNQLADEAAERHRAVKRALEALQDYKKEKNVR